MTRMAPITVTVPKPLLKRVDRYAKSNGETRSAAVRRLLLDALTALEGSKAAFTDPNLRRAMLEAFSDPDVAGAMLKAMGHDVNPDQLQLFANTLKEATKDG